MSSDRVILIDLLHNPGSTERQISHRIKTQSPHQIRAGLTRLESAGKIRLRSDFFEITKTGFNCLCPEDPA